MTQTTATTELYVGTKHVFAYPMTRKEYNDYRGWDLPADEDGTEPGYLVEYTNGGKPNHPDHKGYISWSPKEVFEESYKLVTDADNSSNLDAVEKGSIIYVAAGLTVVDVGSNKFHDYHVLTSQYPHSMVCSIGFQNGTIPKVGINGLTNEALLSIIEHRITGLDGLYPCEENKEAIKHINKAIDALYARTANRVKRGV